MRDALAGFLPPEMSPERKERERHQQIPQCGIPGTIGGGRLQCGLGKRKQEIHNVSIQLIRVRQTDTGTEGANQ